MVDGSSVCRPRRPSSTQILDLRFVVHTGWLDKFPPTTRLKL